MNALPRMILMLPVACVCVPTVASAQDMVTSAGDRPDIRILVGAGVQTKPAYPGAAQNRLAVARIVTVWREDERFPAEAPDESTGISLFRGDNTTAGPALKVAPRRSATAVIGLPAVNFGVEAGAFVQHYFSPRVRVRGELRQGIGAHRGLVGNLAADLVIASPDQHTVATLGPRMRWGNARYNRAYFGVSHNAATASGLTAFEPGSGINAIGLASGVYQSLTPRLGLYGFGGYDRLVGRSARSPHILRDGQRDQFTAGLALTYTFTIAR